MRAPLRRRLVIGGLVAVLAFTGLAVGAPAPDASAAVTLLPSVSINDVSVVEGNAGTTQAKLVISLSRPSLLPVVVSYATHDGSAHAGSDYTSTSATLVLGPLTTSAAVVVPVLGDTKPEPDETFTVALSSPLFATISDGSGTVTIRNDDGPLRADVVPTSNPASVALHPGDSATFQLGISNLGPSDTSGRLLVTINGGTLAVLPTGCDFFDGLTYECIASSLDAGASRSFLFTLTYTHAGPDSVDLQAQGLDDANLANDFLSVPVSVNPLQADIAPTVASSPINVHPPADVVVPVGVVNHGPDATQARVFVTANGGAVTGVPSGCSFFGGAATYECDSSGALASGASQTFPFTIHYDTPGNDSIELQAQGLLADPVPANDEMSVPVIVADQIADVEAISGASRINAHPGDTKQASFGVTNHGPDAVSARDLITFGGANVTQVPAGCSFFGGAATYECDVASLAPGATASFSFRLTFPSAASSSIEVQAQGTGTDSNSANDVLEVPVVVADVFADVAAVGPASVAAHMNEPVTVDIGLVNHGPDATSGRVLFDTDGQVTAIPASCHLFDSLTYECDTSSLASGASQVFTITLTFTDTGSHFVHLQAQGLGTDQDSSNDEILIPVTVA